MDQFYPLTSTAVLVVDPSSSRRDAMRSALSDQVGAVLFRDDLPQSLGDVGPDSSVISTLVLSIDPLEAYPTSIVRSVRDRWPWMSVVLVDGPPSVQMVKASLRAGAADYLARDESTAGNVSEAVVNSLRRSWRTQIGNVVYTRSISEGKLVGSSDAMQPVLRRLGLAIENDLNVLLRGESGTGKTLTARAIHAQSTREGAPLMQIDCRGLKPDRARELFLGGLFSAEDAPTPQRTATVLRDLVGGSLVLDHVDELGSEAQEIIAHALDTRPVLANDRSADQDGVQFIGVVSSPPPIEGFRSDLYHQLAELPISLPPLRDRPDDIVGLARHFLRKHGGEERASETEFSAEAKAALREHSWPGNVRQLENVIKRSVRISSASTLDRDDLLLSDAVPRSGEGPDEDASSRTQPPPPRDRRRERSAVSEPPPGDGHDDPDASDAPTLEGITFGEDKEIPSMEELKKQAVKRAYDLFDGDVDRAAVALDIGRSTMYRMIRRHNLRDDDS
jgi:DNA-binding NtrC family response regulator